MTQIFTCYRTQDEPVVAGLLDSELSRSFGPDVMFYASRSLPPGERFRPAMIDAVRKSRVLLAVIGQRWLNATDRQGKRCLDDPSDFVRLEIRTAFEHGVRVVPLRVQDAARVPATALPADIAALAECQDITLHHRRIGADVPHLVAKLRELVPELRDDAPALGAARAGEPAAVARFSVNAERIDKNVQIDTVTVGGDWVME